jgi:hypothetical protein
MARKSRAKSNNSWGWSSGPGTDLGGVHDFGTWDADKGKAYVRNITTKAPAVNEKSKFFLKVLFII